MKKVIYDQTNCHCPKCKSHDVTFTCEGNGFVAYCRDCGKTGTPKSFYQSRQRAAKRIAYESCGLKRVRGALGGVYWE